MPEALWRDKGAYAGDREKYKALFYGVVRICTDLYEENVGDTVTNDYTA